MSRWRIHTFLLGLTRKMQLLSIPLDQYIYNINTYALALYISMHNNTRVTRERERWQQYENPCSKQTKDGIFGIRM
jgi:hypothetical protein